MKLLYFSIKIFSFIILIINYSFPQDSDYSFIKIYSFKIEESESGKLQLKSTLKVENTYLSERSINLSQYFEYSHFFDPMEDFNWYFKKESFKKDKINYIVPELKDVFISNSKIYYFSIHENIKPGDKVRYDYTKNYIDISYFPLIEIPNIDYIENFKIIIEHPEYIKPEFSIFFPQKEFIYNIDSSNNNSTIFETGVINLSKKLSYFPYNEVSAYIFISLKNKGKSINPTNSKEFTEWYSSMVNLKPELDIDNRNILFEDLLKVKTEIEKVEIIYNYVRENYRYIAEEQDINSFVPREPSIVIKRGYGDCKERAYLISAIAREHSIKVNMAVVSSENSPELEEVYLTKFDHVICAYDTGNDIIFFDPTAKYCEFGNLPENVIGKEALILDPDNPRKVVINAPNNKPSIEIEIKADIDSLNMAKAKVILRNDYFSAALHAKKELTTDKLENLLSTLLTSNLYKISLDYFKFEKEDYNSIVFNAEADISHFVISSPSKKYVPKTPFIFYNKDILLRKEDSYNIYLNNRMNSLIKIYLYSPNYNISLENLEIIKKESEMKFTATLENEDSTLIFLYEITQQLKKYDSSNRESLLEFCEEYLNNKTNMFILRKNNETNNHSN